MDPTIILLSVGPVLALILFTSLFLYIADIITHDTLDCIVRIMVIAGLINIGLLLLYPI